MAYRVRGEIEVVDHPNGRAPQIKADDGVGFVVQEIRFSQPPEEAILHFSALVKTESVTGQGAGLNIGVYDADSLLLQNVDMGYSSSSSVTGTTAWRRYVLRAVVSDNAALQPP